MNTITRIKMVKAMEFICRNVNDEDVFEEWLMDGVADGDIAYGNLSVDSGDIEDKYGVAYHIDDEHFKELMGTFLHVMSEAWKSGGLYCDGICHWGKENK